MWTDVACSAPALWRYGEFETFFTLAFLLLAIYAVRTFGLRKEESDK